MESVSINPFSLIVAFSVCRFTPENPQLAPTCYLDLFELVRKEH
jgi:hypothetical protein